MARRSRSKASGHRRQRESLGVGALSVFAGASVLVILAIVISLVVAVNPLTMSREGKRPVAGTEAERPSQTMSSPSRPSLTTGTARPASRRWVAVLDTLDSRRAAAWRLGRPDLLSRVYTAESAALRADRKLLTDYARRGLRVSGVDLRFTAVSVVRRSVGSVSLLVVDRLGQAVAVDQAGHRERLPRDLPTRHRVDLRLVGRDWRIARVALV